MSYLGVLNSSRNADLVNYIENGKALNGTAGWNAYADAAGAAPVDGTGGSPQSGLWGVTTTSPLRGSSEFLLSKTGSATRQGQGASYDFTIDNADLAKVLTVTFDYEVVSGTYANGDVTVYIIADPSGTPQVIQPAGYTVMAGSVGTKLRQIATFQTLSNVKNYRLCLHIATASTQNYVLAVDTVRVGPQTVVYGSPVTDWVSYTPTITTATGTMTNFQAAGRWKREGDNLKVSAQIRFTGAVGTWSGPEIRLPAGLQIDFTKSPFNDGSGNFQVASGAGRITRPGVGNYTLSGVAANTFGADRFRLVSKFTNDAGSVAGVVEPLFDSATNTITNIFPISFTTNDIIYIQEFTVPILGWSSSVQMSNDTDTRVVAARAFSSNSGAWPTVDTVINFATLTYDTHGAITTGAGWNYKIPVSGYYKVSASHEATSSGATTLILRARKNGSQFATGTFPMNAATSNIIVRVDGQNYFNAGDTIDIAASSSAGTGTFVASASASVVQVERLSGPATIAASETVAAKYYERTGGDSIGTSNTTVVFSDKDFDTHGAYNSSSGVWTCPVAGKYLVQAKLFTAPVTLSTTQRIYIAINDGTERVVYGSRQFGAAASRSESVFLSGVIDCLAGETFTVVANSSVATTVGITGANDPGENFVSFERIGY